MSIYNPTGKELVSALEAVIGKSLKRGQTMSDSLEKNQLDEIYDEFVEDLDAYIEKAS